MERLARCAKSPSVGSVALIYQVASRLRGDGWGPDFDGAVILTTNSVLAGAKYLARSDNLEYQNISTRQRLLTNCADCCTRPRPDLI